MVTIEKLLEKSPIGSVIVRNGCVFNELHYQMMNGIWSTNWKF